MSKLLQLAIAIRQKEKIEDVVYNLAFGLRKSELIVAYVDVPIYAYFIREQSLVSFINGFNVITLAKRIYRYATNEEELRTKDALYKECIKRCLGARYFFHLHNRTYEESQSNILAKECFRKISSNKLMYWILIYFPIVYRLFRIVQDPTMLKYEENVKLSNRTKVNK